MPPHTHQQDLSHWQQLQQGSPQALAALYDIFFPQLFRYGSQLVPDRALVQDTLQDFFVELYARHSSLSDVRQVRSYLYVAFRRKLLRLHLKQQRFTPYDSGSATEAHTLSYEQKLVLDELGETQRASLTKALNSLSSRQKEAVFLRFYEEMDYDEIATVLDLKEVKYARTLIYRSIASLREAMESHKASLTLYSLSPLALIPFCFK
uniref:Sigma-70 family RNA polymerase sigma factor n=1 Tax=Roseihalotalea indica TaxID=2867963 RepID=A0AA49GK26_9BACT|nr:sigma-70 family RNA polymerase sigma factor [Tunicatimonas sp. TK19036]